LPQSHEKKSWHASGFPIMGTRTSKAISLPQLLHLTLRLSNLKSSFQCSNGKMVQSGTLPLHLWLSGAHGWDMHTDFIAQIRAHAHALVKMARVQPDLELALQLESLALNLLKITHDFEVRTKI
jgi:hypothetical protein